MPELHLRKPGFTYGACGPFTKNCERIQKFRETDDLKHIYENELNIKLVLLKMPHILILKIWLRELFPRRFWHIKLMKLL